MRELEQVESAIQASRQWIATLEVRRDALTAELDRITRPQRVLPKPPLKTIGPGFEYRGALFGHFSYIDIYTGLLRRLWTDFPEKREAMAKAMGNCGTTRTYVATSIAELFAAHPTEWAQRHSRTLVVGWYVDVNLNLERMRRLLPAAVRAAGFKLGHDVKIYWRATRLPADSL